MNCKNSHLTPFSQASAKDKALFRFTLDNLTQEALDRVVQAHGEAAVNEKGEDWALMEATALHHRAAFGFVS